jgi:biopolymer transport protein ExbD
VLPVTHEGTVSIDTLRVPDGLLDAYLTAFLKENPGRKLELEADKRLALGDLLKVWDALTRAGIPIRDVPARIRVPADGDES